MRNLQQVLTDYSTKKFSYNGMTDCCAFAGSVVEAIHGYNPMDTFRYINKEEAFNAIGRHGDLLAAVNATLGPALPVEGYEDGDVLIAKQEDGQWIVGVAVGGRMAVKTSTGLMDWPMRFASYRWRP